MSKVADQSIILWVFLLKIWTCLISLVSRLEAYLVGHTNRSDDQICQFQLICQCVVSGYSTMDRLTILVCGPNKSITPTNYFLQSSTSRPFYASRRCDSSACGIPTLPTHTYLSKRNHFFCIWECISLALNSIYIEPLYVVNILGWFYFGKLWKNI